MLTRCSQLKWKSADKKQYRTDVIIIEADEDKDEMKRAQWKALFQPRILQRGWNYYEEDAVKGLSREGDRVQALVRGSEPEPYDVEIDLSGGEVQSWSCDCPYAEDGTPCKHLAAVFYALEDQRWQTSEPETRPAIEKLVSELTLSQAQALLLRLAERDGKVADQIRLAVEPISPQQLFQWERKVDEMLAQAADRYGYIDYDRAWDTMCELDDFLSDAAGRMLDAGLVWEAFLLTGYALRAAVQCDMDDSDGGLSMLAETCADLWRGQIGVASLSLRREMHRWLGNAVSTASDLLHDYYLEAQLELFRDPEFLRENIRQLDRLIQAEEKKENGRYGAVSHFVLKRLGLMEELGLPQEEVRQTEMQYRRLPEVRERMICRLLEQQQYGEAESLLQESKALDAKYPGRVSGYSEELIRLYGATGQEERLREELEFQVFQCWQRELTYVKQLKECTLPERWPELRERLLSSKSMSEDRREELLEMDGLYDRLMERVAYMESLHTLDRWESVLWPRFPEKMQTAYIRCIEEQMRCASSRSQYASVIAYLKKLRASPKGADKKLAEQWRAAYPRRRAMLDELRKAGY